MDPHLLCFVSGTDHKLSGRVLNIRVHILYNTVGIRFKTWVLALSSNIVQVLATKNLIQIKAATNIHRQAISVSEKTKLEYVRNVVHPCSAKLITSSNRAMRSSLFAIRHYPSSNNFKAADNIHRPNTFFLRSFCLIDQEWASAETGECASLH